MPFVKKIEKKTSSVRNENTDSRELRRKAYNNTTWRKLREEYIHENPLCERHLKEKGQIVPAEDVHHKKSPFKNGEINYNLLLDKNNLMSVCKQCHAEIHNKQNGNITVSEVIKQLDDLFNENIKDEDLE